MSAGKELYEIDRWIRSRLASGTALCDLIGGTAAPRIYSGIAPDNASFPFVLYDIQDTRDAAGIAGERGCVVADYVVRAVTDEPSYDGGAAIMAHVDGLLHQQSGSVVIGTVTVLEVLGCIRMHSVRYLEFEEGRRYNHLGGIYRIWGAST